MSIPLRGAAGEANTSAWRRWSCRACIPWLGLRRRVSITVHQHGAQVRGVPVYRRRVWESTQPASPPIALPAHARDTRHLVRRPACAAGRLVAGRQARPCHATRRACIAPLVTRTRIPSDDPWSDCWPATLWQLRLEWRQVVINAGLSACRLGMGYGGVALPSMDGQGRHSLSVSTPVLHTRSQCHLQRRSRIRYHDGPSLCVSPPYVAVDVRSQWRGTGGAWRLVQRPAPVQAALIQRPLHAQVQRSYCSVLLAMLTLTPTHCLEAQARAHSCQTRSPRPSCLVPVGLDHGLP